MYECVSLLLTSSVSARAPDANGSYVPTTVLFPYIPPKDWGGSVSMHDKAIAYYDRIRTIEFTECEIRSEYHDQIRNVAAILGQKVTWNRRASGLFRWQVLSIPVVVALIGLMKAL